MKKLSFALAIALICISFSSCENKSVISPLDENFKITTFSPISGFTASKVTLFGENLTKDSIVTVTFGDQPVEILLRAKDSVIVKIPDIAVGLYNVSVKTKTKTYVYDKQFELLQNDFKITTFSPIAGFVKSQITLYGENLNKYSDLSVKIGSQTAEIVSQSNDSITIKIPEAEPGLYDIIVNIKSKSLAYKTKFEVLNRPLIDDLTQIKSFSILVNGLDIKYIYYTSHTDYPYGGGSSRDTLIDSAFKASYKNSHELIIENADKSKFNLTERYGTPWGTAFSTCKFETDIINKKLKNLEYKTYSFSQFSASNGLVTTTMDLILNLSEIKFDISDNELMISGIIHKQDISTNMTKFYYHYLQEYHHDYRPTSSTSEKTMMELLGINDDATIEIKFTK